MRHISPARLTAILVLSITTFAVPALAQSVQLLGDFRAWSAYATSDGAGKMCFVLSKPTSVSPEPDGYTQAYLYLTHRPADDVRNELNLVAGYDFAPGSDATLTIGSQTYQLFTSGDAAWLQDPGQSQNVAGAMRAGSSLTIEGTTAAGAAVKETFSLSGVTAASRAIDDECR